MMPVDSKALHNTWRWAVVLATSPGHSDSFLTVPPWSAGEGGSVLYSAACCPADEDYDFHVTFIRGLKECVGSPGS